MAVGRGVGVVDDGLRAPELKGRPPGQVLLGDEALLKELHGTGDGHPAGDGVKPQAVAEVVGLGDGDKILYAAAGPVGPATLILRPFALAFGGKLGYPGALYGAGKTAPVLLEVAFLHQGLAAYLLGAFKDPGLEVAGGVEAVFVDDVVKDLGPEFGKPLPGYLVLTDDLKLLADELLEGVRALGAVLAPYHDGLKPLSSHHRAHPGAAGCPVFVVNDTGETHQVFPGRADTGHLGLLLAHLFPEAVGHLVGLKTPEVGSGPELGLVPVKGEIYGLLGRPFKDDEVVACGLKFRPEVPPGV